MIWLLVLAGLTLGVMIERQRPGKDYEFRHAFCPWCGAQLVAPEQRDDVYDADVPRP